MLPVPHGGNIYAGIAVTLGSGLQGFPAGSGKKKKVKPMQNAGILIAGIFLACAVCAGIPAVAAADSPDVVVNPHASAVPQETPQVTTTAATPAPWWQTLPQQGMDQVKSWWNGILQHQRTTTSSTVSATPAVTPVITSATPPVPQKG